MIRKRRFIPAWDCDSADDYYAQFNPPPEPEEPDDWEDDRCDDSDCEYWQRIMRDD